MDVVSRSIAMSARAHRERRSQDWSGMGGYRTFFDLSGRNISS